MDLKNSWNKENTHIISSLIILQITFPLMYWDFLMTYSNAAVSSYFLYDVSCYRIVLIFDDGCLDQPTHFPNQRRLSMVASFVLKVTCQLQDIHEDFHLISKILSQVLLSLGTLYKHVPENFNWLFINRLTKEEEINDFPCKICKIAYHIICLPYITLIF